MATPSDATYISGLEDDAIVLLFNRMDETSVKSLLMQKRSPFRRVVPLLFKRLCITEDDKVVFDCNNSTLYVGVEARVDEVRELLRDCDKFLKCAYFYDIPVHDLPQGHDELAELLAEYLELEISLEFTTGRNYALIDLFANKFKGKGVKFNALKFRINEGENMGGLKHPFTADIKVLHLETSHIGLFNSKWKSIGQSLEKVNLVIGAIYGDLSKESMWYKCIEEMKTHAKKLSSISIKGVLSCTLNLQEAQLVDFIVSYGKQLSKLKLGNMSAKSCAKIVDGCPNVNVSLHNENNFFGGISALGTHLRKLTLEYGTHKDGIVLEDMEKRLKDAMKNCYGLEKLTILNIYENDSIKSIFPIEMPCLKKLNLGFIRNPALLNHIASVTSSLKLIKFTCAYPIHTSAIDALACANPGLEKVEIFELPLYNTVPKVRNSAETAAVVQDLVASLSKCIKPKNIFVQLSESSESPSEGNLRQIFRPFTTKGVTFKFNFKFGMSFLSIGFGRLLHSQSYSIITE